uniref:Uncharacterized protein n=1 Tax=Meloidogyne incognita TaxID=6306 RepID=A0A914LVA5_MELIC
MCVLTRRCKSDDEFIIGKWYKENGQTRSYKNVANFVPTNLIRQIEKNGSGKTTIELVLPVFFVPDLSGMDVFGHTPSLKNPNSLGIPICPFFGTDVNEFISSVKWSYGFCSYSDQLYSLKINLSYAVGVLPEWTPQNVGIIKPWNYEEYPFVSIFCSPSRDEGIVVEQVACPWDAKSFYCCMLLNKSAEMVVSIVPEKRKALFGECRVYWKFKLNCYDCPVTIAIDCPQIVNVSSDKRLQLRKIRSDLFELTLRNVDFTSSKSTTSHYVLSWLGILMDPFLIIKEKFDPKKDDKMPLKLQIRPTWHLAKWSVAWTVVDIVKENKSNSNDLVRYESNGYVSDNRDDSSSPSTYLLNIPSNERKKTVAVLMTVRAVLFDAVFLFYNAKTSQFTQRSYAKFHKSLSFEFNFGEWFELEYMDIPQNKTQIIILAYSKVDKFVTTRVRDGLCAQFSTKQDRFLNVWHTVFPCLEKNCYYEDMGWWPWLCRKCFPGLSDVVDTKTNGSMTENNISNGEGIRDKSKPSELEEFARRMRDSFVFSLDDLKYFLNNKKDLKNNDCDVSTQSSSPVIIMNDTKEQDKKQDNQISVKPQQRQVVGYGSSVYKHGPSEMVMAVLMAVRQNGDSVFLFFDKEQGKFSHRVYSDPPNKISGSPEIGKWYKLEHRHCTSNLALGQKISICSLAAIGNPVETRIKNGILAQFNTKDKFISVWHDNIEKWHNYKASPDGPWWPKLCSMCYPSSFVEHDRRFPRIPSLIHHIPPPIPHIIPSIPPPVIAPPQRSNSQPWTDKLDGLIYTESEECDSDASISIGRKVAAGLSQLDNSPLIAYSPPLDQQRKTSAPRTRPPPISVTGKLFCRVNNKSSDNIDTSTNSLNLTKNPSKVDMFAELVKEERQEMSNGNIETITMGSVLCDGGFGSARMRRFVSGSVTSSNTSPSLN